MNMPDHRRQVFSRERYSGPKAVFRDLRDGLAMGPAWRAFAWDEIQNRYRRSVLGVAWIAIGYLFFVCGIALFFGAYAKADGFSHYVAIGYAAFTFLAGNITDGCVVFSSASTWIKSAPLPFSIYVYKSIARSLFPFGIQLGIAFILLIATEWRPEPTIFLAIPALMLYLINAVWVQFAFGFAAARFGDIAHLVTAVTRILIFITPLLWVFEERVGISRDIALLNPLTHFIEIFRAPILGTLPSIRAWVFALVFTVIGWGLTIFLVGASRRRLPFWI